ncbi:MAG TPA: methylaspartate mutase accessory protein GlmL [Burkholderiales bacterium]|nr:methylaspartate mutase accessory protein GlmL [Burkholderiales bacterium]
MSAALLIDFGSTFTKLRAVDIERRRLIGAGQGPSTVGTDINVGMRAALDDLERRIGRLPRWRYRLASSSAAGGLRMVTIGLVRELTAEAARQAALGAGAKLVGTFAYRLTARDLEQIARLEPDIVLLAGGTDGGNMDVVLHNAAALAKSALTCPIIYAANRAAEEEARRLLSGKLLVCTENVMPELNELNIDPARAAIRGVFIDRIVHAKGLDRAAAEFDAMVMPTPAAVLEGARLLADGAASASGLGSVLVVDPGGATTDVHSVASGAPAPGVVPQGLPEPRVKRTVEGDLGMRHSAAAVVEAAGIASIAADSGLQENEIRRLLESLKAEDLPGTDEEKALDRALARAAIGIAVERHCGTLKTVYTPTGPVTVQSGKDLRGVAAVIGTGGVLAASAAPRAILERALADPQRPLALKPVSPRLLIDREYVLYACGLLQSVEPDAALEFALKHLTEPDRAAALGSAHPR